MTNDPNIITVTSNYTVEDAENGVLPDPKLDEKLRSVVGREFDHAEIDESGWRDVEWNCATEEEAAKLVRALVDNDWPWTILDFWHQPKLMDRFVKRHGIKRTPP